MNPDIKSSSLFVLDSNVISACSALLSHSVSVSVQTVKWSFFIIKISLEKILKHHFFSLFQAFNFNPMVTDHVHTDGHSSHALTFTLLTWKRVAVVASNSSEHVCVNVLCSSAKCLTQRKKAGRWHLVLAVSRLGAGMRRQWRSVIDKHLRRRKQAADRDEHTNLQLHLMSG